MEELEDVVAGFQRHHGRVELQGAVYDVPEIIGRHVLAEKRIGDGEADFTETEIPPLAPEFITQHRQDIRHVEPVVGRKGAENRLLEIDAMGGVVGGMVFQGKGVVMAV